MLKLEFDEAFRKQVPGRKRVDKKFGSTGWFPLMISIAPAELQLQAEP